MDQDLALSVLGDVLKWDLEKSRQEFRWLQMMSRFKYDGYRDFVAGMRFLESLAAWLQQFTPEKREAAYQFVKNHLIYFGPAEIQHLVEQFYPAVVRRRLMSCLAGRTGKPSYLVGADPKSKQEYSRILRRCLFFGLSDGAKIDTFRRDTTGIVSNEQVLLATEISDEKWKSVLKKLREDENDQTATFEFIYLIDDFVATGTTLNGKLERFWRDFDQYNIADTHVSDTWVLVVHHYLSTEDIPDKLAARNTEQRNASKGQWFPRVEFSFSMLLSEKIRVTEPNADGFWELIQKYYNSSIETDHTRKGGKDVKLGFGSCALPLVLEHNTPNNSISLLWAETDDSNGQHAMRPLFRRRQRHWTST